ncbi:hypothetical protein ABIB62_004532 [Mucilaginibacter sp. UYP25]
MGIIEWLLLVIIIIFGYKQYQKQEYWLDRKIAGLIRLIKSKLS